MISEFLPMIFPPAVSALIHEVLRCGWLFFVPFPLPYLPHYLVLQVLWKPLEACILVIPYSPSLSCASYVIGEAEHVRNRNLGCESDYLLLLLYVKHLASSCLDLRYDGAEILLRSLNKQLLLRL